MDHTTHLKFAKKIAETLKDGGRAVFFPWQINQEDDQDSATLRLIENYWKALGIEVIKEDYPVEELKKQMEDRETTLTDHSPVFKNQKKPTLTALILVNPAEGTSLTNPLLDLTNSFKSFAYT